MKLRELLTRFEKKKERSITSYYKDETLADLGREQFKKLVDRGLAVPVALL